MLTRQKSVLCICDMTCLHVQHASCKCETWLLHATYCETWLIHVTWRPAHIICAGAIDTPTLLAVQVLTSPNSNCINMQIFRFSYVFNMWDMPCLHVRHFCVCYGWHDLSMCTGAIETPTRQQCRCWQGKICVAMCDMTQLHVHYASCKCETCLIHVWDILPCVYNMRGSHRHANTTSSTDADKTKICVWIYTNFEFLIQV